MFLETISDLLSKIRWNDWMILESDGRWLHLNKTNCKHFQYLFLIWYKQSQWKPKQILHIVWLVGVCSESDTHSNQLNETIWILNLLLWYTSCIHFCQCFLGVLFLEIYNVFFPFLKGNVFGRSTNSILIIKILTTCRIEMRSYRLYGLSHWNTNFVFWNRCNLPAISIVSTN